MREKLIELNEILCRSLYYNYDEVYKAMTVDTLVTAENLISNGVTIQKWIPVSERMPEPMEWVLCACRANIIEVLRYDHIMYDWDTTMPNRCYMKGFVTHWMPLPEIPKGV